MDLTHPANRQPLIYLTGRNPQASPIAAPDCVPQPYLTLGTHPDVVEHLWDQINAVYPLDARAIIYRYPGLIHPVSGIILALGWGTAYALRLPTDLYPLALQRGGKTVIKWSASHSTDIQATLGEDWLFGSWPKEERDWCQKAYDFYQA
jgi:hypothetical protein